MGVLACIPNVQWLALLPYRIESRGLKYWFGVYVTSGSAVAYDNDTRLSD